MHGFLPLGARPWRGRLSPGRSWRRRRGAAPTSAVPAPAPRDPRGNGDRPAVISRFKDGDAPVFLISLKAGGFGLNLTEADYCFVCDPWWNPAAEAQAVDRAHRIGQQRPVTVCRLVSANTIEERVVGLQDRKRALFDAAIDDGELFGTALSSDDIREMLG